MISPNAMTAKDVGCQYACQANIAGLTKKKCTAGHGWFHGFMQPICNPFSTLKWRLSCAATSIASHTFVTPEYLHVNILENVKYCWWSDQVRSVIRRVEMRQHCSTHLFYPIAIETAGPCDVRARELIEEIGRSIIAVTEELMRRHTSTREFPSLSREETSSHSSAHSTTTTSWKPSLSFNFCLFITIS